MPIHIKPDVTMPTTIQYARSQTIPTCFVHSGEHLHILVHTRPPDPPPSNHSSRRPSLVIPARDLLPGNSGNLSDSIGPSDESASVRLQDGSSTSPPKSDGEKALRRRSSGGFAAEAPLRGLAVPGQFWVTFLVRRWLSTCDTFFMDQMQHAILQWALHFTFLSSLLFPFESYSTCFSLDSN
jgi:hypothetical protein